MGIGQDTADISKKQLKNGLKLAKFGDLKSGSIFSDFPVLATSGKFCSISTVLGTVSKIFSLFHILMNTVDKLQHFLNTCTHFRVPKMENPQNRYFYPKKKKKKKKS